MMSLRNGTALAIVLSVVFVIAAVVMRDSLPGFAQDNPATSTSLVDQLVQTQEPGTTSGDASLGQTTTVGIETTSAEQTYTWDDDAYGDDDDDYGDHDDDHDKKDHDRKDHHDDDDDDD